MINISQEFPIIGIYKITSPSGKVYIGQSVNIKNRWKNYKWMHNSICGPYLLRSLKKYGHENHKFEIIEECSIEQLNERETYWKQIELNKVNNDWSKVLFCELYDKSTGPRSKEVIEKIRQSNTGKIRSEEFKRKISQSQKGRPKPEGYSKKISKALLGKIRTDETKKRMSECRKGKPNLKNRKPKPPGFMSNRTKSVHQISSIDNNIINTYPSISAASKATNIKAGYISGCCNGDRITAGKYKWMFT